MSHDLYFAELRARREAERAATIKVTWRKVSALTGGGWSGLGPNGALVFVQERRPSGFEYGTRDGRVRTVKGFATTMARAKRAAERLLDPNEAPHGAGTESIMSESTNPTAETLVEGIGEAISPDKAPYSRIRINDGTVAYCSARKDGVLLDFAKGTVDGAPARFQKSLEDHGSRRTMRVTAKNLKGARSLLEWIAKQD